MAKMVVCTHQQLLQYKTLNDVLSLFEKQSLDELFPDCDTLLPESWSKYDNKFILTDEDSTIGFIATLELYKEKDGSRGFQAFYVYGDQVEGFYVSV